MNRLTWQAVALIAVLAGVVIALATLTGWGSGDILAVIGILAGIGGGAAVAGGVAGRVEQLQQETTAQTATLDTVARRVNGELDERIAAAVDQGNADLIRLLRENGVLK